MNFVIVRLLKNSYTYCSSSGDLVVMGIIFLTRILDFDKFDNDSAEFSSP